MKKVDPSFEWKMPIDFYGKVVDQDNRPLPEASIHFSWNDTSARGTSKAETMSDPKGAFSLIGRRGKALTVSVSKDGYHTNGGRGGRGFEYAAFFESHFHRPDPGNPVTFRLTKKLDREPLIVRHVSEDLSYDAGEYYYDLQLGTVDREVSAKGALKLTFERSRSPQGTSFDWKVGVEATNAGLQETKDEFGPLAPEDGYTSSWQGSSVAGAQPFPRSCRVRFYIRTADNRYARVDLELVHPNERNIGPNLTIDSLLNPSGSRNLEFDASKQLAIP